MAAGRGPARAILARPQATADFVKSSNKYPANVRAPPRARQWRGGGTEADVRKIDTRNFRRATRSTSRQINRQIALNLVREHQPISRADLARRLEVGRGLVTSLVNELIEEGSIFEGARAEAPRGRKPKMLFVRTHDRYVVAVDVRFSRTYVMLSDFAGTALALETFDTLVEPGELVEELGRRVERLLRMHGAADSCEGIGLVVPGMVDRGSGKVLNAPQLGWRDVEIRESLAKRTGLRVMIENAPIACALSRMWLGQAAEAAGDFVYVTVSDGVGAGVVVNGEVVRGHDDTAGEFGHVPLDPDGPACLCGARGCWEAYTSNLALISRYLGQRQSPAELRDLLRSSAITAADVIARAHAGDERAARAVEETGHYLALGLAMIVNALNPSMIIVGGEITGAWERVGPMVRAEIERRALAPAAARTPVVPEQPDSYPRLRGAAALLAARAFAAPRVA